MLKIGLHFQKMDKERKKIRCKGCEESFSMLLSLLTHLRNTIICQNAYGKNGYSKMLKLASKKHEDHSNHSKNEEQKEKVIFLNFTGIF